MAKFRAIIDAGDGGLPSAATYYKFFPREPSPVKEMRLSPGTTAALKKTTLASVLDEMARVDSGGVVLLVCHGMTSGLLIDIAAGSNASVEAQSMTTLMTLADRDAAADAARKMPQITDADKEAKANAYVAILKAAGANIVGKVELAEAVKAYDAWFAGEAQKWKLKSPGLRDLIHKMRAVQAKKLERVELRACNVGAGKKGEMAVMKKFFGCATLLAPLAETFFLPPLFIETAAATAKFDPLAGWYFNLFVPGIYNAQTNTVPGTLMWQPNQNHSHVRYHKEILDLNAPSSTAWVRSNPHRARPFPNVSAALKLRVDIWEVDLFKYVGGLATTPATTVHGRHTGPDWDAIRAFVKGFIFPTTTYRQGNFPMAGFWNPVNTTKIWVLPNEPEYVKQIVSL